MPPLVPLALFADFVRFTVLGQAAVALGVNGLLLIMYRGRLPQRAAIAFTCLLFALDVLLVGLGVEVVHRLGGPLTWRSAVVQVATLLCYASAYVLTRKEKP